MKLTLAYCPHACSLVPYILLTEAGAEFEPMPINLGKNQHNSPEYLRINPKAKVPTLIIDGEPLTETWTTSVPHGAARQRAKVAGLRSADSG